jgi:hypothetical protein
VTQGKAPLAFLARREVRSPADVSVLNRGDPPYTGPSLLGWVWSMVRDHDLEGYLQANPDGPTFSAVSSATTMSDDHVMLDVVDSILQHLPALDGPGDIVAQNRLRVLVAALQSILTESGSGFAVDFSDGMRLVRRVDGSLRSTRSWALIPGQPCSSRRHSAGTADAP